MMSSAEAAKKLVAACKREMRRAARDVGADAASEAVFMQAVAGAAVTQALNVLTRDCLEAGVNPLRTVLDGILTSLAVDMQEAGMAPDVVAEQITQQFRDAWAESARQDAAAARRH